MRKDGDGGRATVAACEADLLNLDAERGRANAAADAAEAEVARLRETLADEWRGRVNEQVIRAVAAEHTVQHLEAGVAYEQARAAAAEERERVLREWMGVAVAELGSMPANVEYLGKAWWDEGEALLATAPKPDAEVRDE